MRESEGSLCAKVFGKRALRDECQNDLPYEMRRNLYIY